MCYKLPGPRCTSHALTALKVAKKAYRADETFENYERMMKAEQDYNMTPGGMKAIEDQIAKVDAKGGDSSALRATLERSQVLRKAALEEVKSADRGDVEEEQDNGALHSSDALKPKSVSLPVSVQELEKERSDGDVDYYQLLVREDGTKELYLESENDGLVLHNNYGPAKINSDGSQEHYLYGTLHNDDGPAVHGGGKPDRYFLHGTEQSRERHKAIVEDERKKPRYLAALDDVENAKRAHLAAQNKLIEAESNFNRIGLPGTKGKKQQALDEARANVTAAAQQITKAQDALLIAREAARKPDNINYDDELRRMKDDPGSLAERDALRARVSA